MFGGVICIFVVHGAVGDLIGSTLDRAHRVEVATVPNQLLCSFKSVISLMSVDGVAMSSRNGPLRSGPLEASGLAHSKSILCWRAPSWRESITEVYKPVS